MSNVFKLAPLYLARHHSKSWVFALQSLYPGEFIRAQHPLSRSRKRFCLSVETTDISYFCVELLILGRAQPVADQMRFESPFFSNREA